MQNVKKFIAKSPEEVYDPVTIASLTIESYFAPCIDVGYTIVPRSLSLEVSGEEVKEELVTKQIEIKQQLELEKKNAPNFENPYDHSVETSTNSKPASAGKI